MCTATFLRPSGCSQLAQGPGLDRPWIDVSCHFIYRYENGTEFLPMEADVCDEETEVYVTNLSYYHLVPFETDILE